MRVAECLHIILLSSPLLCGFSPCKAHVHMFIIVIDQLLSFVCSVEVLIPRAWSIEAQILRVKARGMSASILHTK